MTEQRAGPLFTDLYELTMAASYYAHSVFEKATFSLFIRDRRFTRSFFVAAGLEQVLEELASFCFSGQDIRYLQKSGRFSMDFIDYLKQSPQHGHRGQRSQKTHRYYAYTHQ